VEELKELLQFFSATISNGTLIYTQKHNIDSQLKDLLNKQTNQ